MKKHFKKMQLPKLDAYDLAYAVVCIVAYAAVAYVVAFWLLMQLLILLLLIRLLM